MSTPSSPISNQGQAAIETLIAIPLLLLLIFLIIEFSLIYRAKLQLNHATFMAARAGAMNHGCKSAMYAQLHRSMSPLLMKGDASATRYAYVQTIKDQYFPTYTFIETLSPDKATYDAFKTRLPLHPDQVMPCAIQKGALKAFRLNTIIPHTQLGTRGSESKIVGKPGGSASDRITLSEANLLKIRSRYCHKLTTPLVSDLLDAVQWLLPGSQDNRTFYDFCIRGGGGHGSLQFIREKLLVLSSTAIMPMQTPFIRDSLQGK